jgi:2-oxoglutarate/2-oxoacid ferredoxin oxidoreductase subunit alpha
MRQIDLTIEIAGSSGDGTLAAGEILANTLSLIGYHILSFDVYPAEIRGFGKCVAHIRISDKPVQSTAKNVDILISLNDPYGIEQIKNLKETGIVIFDSLPIQEVHGKDCIAGHLCPGMFLYGIPFSELSQKTTQSSKSRNLVALGALSALFDIDTNYFIESLDKKFKKNKDVLEKAEAAFISGTEFVKSSILKIDAETLKISKDLLHEDYKIMSGYDAIAQGAIDGGCKFYAGYPITPATKIMEILSTKLPAIGGTVIQTEDEIAAIGMVTGAAHVGIRAMTATSGPGLCLMTEFIGYNVKIENPIVIIDSQRGGPATGLPTKTEQSDLLMALFASNGDVPRIVMAPTNVEECHNLLPEAFYLAEKYQIPVIFLIDLFLSTCKSNILLKPPDQNKLKVNKLPTLDQMIDYKRFMLTEDGVSPRTIPGMPNGEYIASGLEQDENENTSYYTEVHTKMTMKRHLKLISALKKDVPKPERFGCSGKADLGVLSFGSTTGAVMEAVEIATDKGLKVAGLKQIILNPLHVDELRKFCDDCEQLFIPELNYGGQLADWLSMHIDRAFIRYDKVLCRPFNYNEILEQIEKLL